MFWIFRMRRKLMLFFLLSLLAVSPIFNAADASKSPTTATLATNEENDFLADNDLLSQHVSLHSRDYSLAQELFLKIGGEESIQHHSYQEALQDLAAQFYAILNREETKQIIRQFLDLFIGILEMMKSWLS